MGVMFALAGSLMARSLKRPALGVIRGRIRRLLPPLWAFSAVVLALMFADGWNLGEGPGPRRHLGPGRAGQLRHPDRRPALPLAPRGRRRACWRAPGPDQAAGPLWYLRAYLWFVIASPLLLWAFRRVPWATLLAPLAPDGGASARAS